MIKIIEPHHFLIEKTAGQIAAVFWEAGRSSGMPSKYKNARAFAKARLETFIPKATELLIEVMSRPETPVDQKEQIYQAILERTNDQRLSEMGKMAGLKEFEQTVLYKADTEKPKPVIINTPKIDFDFNSKRV